MGRLAALLLHETKAEATAFWQAQRQPEAIPLDLIRPLVVFKETGGGNER